MWVAAAAEALGLLLQKFCVLVLLSAELYNSFQHRSVITLRPLLKITKWKQNWSN